MVQTTITRTDGLHLWIIADNSTSAHSIVMMLSLVSFTDKEVMGWRKTQKLATVPQHHL